MNRSILIVICDFLLVSLLVFSSPDINRVTEQGAKRAQTLNVATNEPASSGKDLAAAMRLALDEERKNREQLLGELNQARTAVDEREQQAQALQQQLQSREKQAQDLQEQVQSREKLALQLQQQQANLLQQFASAQTNIQRLNNQLQNTSTEAQLSKERLAEIEAEARRRADQAAALQQQLQQLAQSNQMVLNEKQQLAGKLQLAELEKRHATEQAVAMQEQVKLERAEKAKLADGVKALATKSSQLAEEIRENRPLAPNTIFSDFVSNRVEATIDATRTGFFGNDNTRRRKTETILVNDGTNIVAVCHVQDTPLTLFNPGTDWESLTGVLNHNAGQVPIRSLSFSFRDPRVAWVPVTEAEAHALGSKIYRISSDPFKFQDAVLVGANEGYYGECRFQIDLNTPDYVKLDNSFLKGLFGKFNPSRGDLVFSKTGELLGIMVNSTYCIMIRNFDAGATLRFAEDTRAQRTGDILSGLYSQLVQMPVRLQ